MALPETAAQILSNPLSLGTPKIGSPGLAYGNMVIILGHALSQGAPDVEDEIKISKPNVMLENLQKPEATTAIFFTVGLGN